jgi:hypothetical protein
MSTVTLYKPEGAETFMNVRDVRIEQGVLTFSFDGKKIHTTLPFLVEEKP